MRTLIIISDNTSRRVYKLDDTDSNNILELAMYMAVENLEKSSF